MNKITKSISNAALARGLANLLGWLACLLILLLAIGLILSFIGKQSFTLQTSAGTYHNATFSDIEFNWLPEGFSVHLGDNTRVHACQFSDEVDFITHIGIFARTVVLVVPFMVSLWLLRRVLNNIHKRSIFTNKNADYLLYCGLMRILVFVFVPFIQIFISYVANLFTDSQIILSAQPSLATLFMGLIFIVCAHVIRQGIREAE